jgi:hypothetical protein
LYYSNTGILWDDQDIREQRGIIEEIIWFGYAIRHGQFSSDSSGQGTAEAAETGDLRGDPDIPFRMESLYEEADAYRRTGWGEDG